MSNARISGHFVLAILCAPLLMGGACEKKATKPNDTGAMTALDNAGSSQTAAAEGPADNTPLTGIDVSKLDGDKSTAFYKLINSLKSPCGKAQSLRASFTSDTSCKRAPFAVRYLVAMLSDGAQEDDARGLYAKKYDKPAQPVTLDVSKAPHEGADDARIKIVEFFDYECPHCAHFKGELDQVLGEKSGQVSAYFLMYPLGKFPGSQSAAQGALAAHSLGKFKEMHDKLFSVAGAHGAEHSREAVFGYAKDMGLDPAKFAKAYDDAAAQVAADHAQGERANIDSTPSVFFNDRKYEGPMYARYLEMWIDEELAVNR